MSGFVFESLGIPRFLCVCVATCGTFPANLEHTAFGGISCRGDTRTSELALTGNICGFLLESCDRSANGGGGKARVGGGDGSGGALSFCISLFGVLGLVGVRNPCRLRLCVKFLGIDADRGRGA